MNTWLAHTDDNVWNTNQDNFPLNGFWAPRLLIEPKNASSGPTKRRLQAYQRSGPNEVHSSREGLEAAWIPYGGRISGYHACPGRVLAKRIMLLSFATIATFFKVDILADKESLGFGSLRFGFGIPKSRGRLP